MSYRKAQRNPSTLKIIRNSLTGKILRSTGYMASQCEWCDTYQPAWIDVIFTSVQDQDCCELIFVTDWNTSGIAAVINNTFRCTWRIGSTGCYYGYDIGTIQNCYNFYYSADGSCTDFAGSYDITHIHLRVRLQELGVLIWIVGWRNDNPNDLVYIFNGTINYTGDDACGVTDNTATNLLTPCFTGPMDFMCVGGTAQIIVP
jgi:hypothetical protein